MDIGFQLFSARSFPLADVLKKMKHFIAARDNPRDIDRFASRSIASIKALGV